MKQFCVADIFEIPLLHNARLVCGQQGVRNLITGVNIIEAPDVVNWLQGGEVLLTNLYSLDQLGSIPAFIEGLAAKKLGALLVKTGVFVDEIPPEMIAVAERCSLPIIEIDKAILYRDIAFAITEKLLDDRVALLKFFKETHNRFIQLSLNNASSQQIIDALAQVIGNPVIVYDRDFKPVRATDPQILGATPLERQAEELPHYTRHCVLSGPEQEEFEQIVFPISVIGHVKIYLAVCTLKREVQEAHYIAIENAITSLMIEFVKQQAVGEVEKRFHNDLLGDLLSGRIVSPEAIHERASLLQWDLKKSHAVVSFSLHNERFAEGQKGIGSQRLAYDHLYALLAARFPQSPMQVRTDKLIMLWGLDLAEGKNWLFTVRAQLEKVWKNWEKAHKKTELRVGIGDVALDLASLSRSFQEAEDTLKIMQQVTLASPINAYPELGVFRLLCQFGEREALAAFIPHPLYLLLQTKQGIRNDLVKTLQVYLACDKNMAQAAGKLFVHHKTVAYRIEQIKKISGLSLTDPEEILQLQLGFKILTLLGVGAQT